MAGFNKSPVGKIWPPSIPVFLLIFGQFLGPIAGNLKKSDISTIS
jgi:hypothetical protein